MKLTDLEPRWYAPTGRDRTGLTFLCPHCRACRLAIPLKRPLDGGAPVPMGVKQMCAEADAARKAGQERPGWAWDTPATFLWDHAGDSFETLTLSPSVDASASGCWHGFITNGEVTNA